MPAPSPSPRRIAGALDVLLALPAPALEALAEQLIDRLDAMDAPGMDLEPDDDGEADPDGEAGPWDDGATWAPVKGPDGCGVLRLAGAS